MAKLDLASKDILLSLLYAPTNSAEEQPIIGRTRIIKLMFIFQKEIFTKFKNDSTTLENIDFDAWDYGPWSKNIYDDIEFLSNLGFIKAVKSEQDANFREASEYLKWESEGDDVSEVDSEEYSLEEFSVTELGKVYVEKQLWSAYSSNQKDVLKAFKTKFNSLPLYALLRYVYRKYPDTTENSLIKNKVLAND